jgi:putative inorganic carbon (hco3(-)) transporter
MRWRFVLIIVAVFAMIVATLPRLISVADYLLHGGEKIYVVIPILGALVLAVWVLFLLMHLRYFSLFTYFIIALPLLSALHRRLEIEISGAQFYLETAFIILLFFLIQLQYQRSKSHFSLLVVFVLLMVFGSLVSAALNDVLDFRVFWFTIQEFVLPFLFFLITVKLIQTRAQVDAVVRTLIVSILVFSVLSVVWIFVLGQTIDVDTGLVFSAQTRINSGFRRLLVGAGFVTGNVGNRVFLIILPLAAAALQTPLFIKKNIPSLMAIVLSLYFIIASEHRAAMVSIALMLIFYVLVSRTQKVDLVIKFAGLFLLALIFSEQIQGYLGRRILLVESLFLDGSARKRFVMWRFALDLFRERPFFGVGPLQYLVYARSTMAQAITAHNYYVNLLAELGLFGFLSYLGLVLTTMIKGVINFRKISDVHLKKLAFGILLGLMSYQFVLTFAGGRLTHNSVIYIHSLYWVAVGIMWVLPWIDRNSPSSNPETSSVVDRP